MLRIVFFIITSSLLFSCNEDCSRLTFKQKELSSNSEMYQSWMSIDSFIFVDSTGEEKSYSAGYPIDIDDYSVYFEHCEGVRFSGFFQSEYKLRLFYGPDSTYIAFAHIVDFDMEEDNYKEENLLDHMVCSIFDNTNSTIDPISRLYFITDIRSSNYNKSDLNARHLVYHDSLSFNGTVYHQVYEQRNGNPKMWYTVRDGVVAFTNRHGYMLSLKQ